MIVHQQNFILMHMTPIGFLGEMRTIQQTLVSIYIAIKTLTTKTKNAFILHYFLGIIQQNIKMSS